MHECRREIALAEQLTADKYAALLSAVSSVHHASPPVKPVVAEVQQLLLPASESRRSKVRDRAYKLIAERSGVKRGVTGVHDNQV